MNIAHLDHLNMTVADLDRARAWYQRLFDFEPVEAGVRHGRRWEILRAGEAMLCLYEWPEGAPPGSSEAHAVNHFGLRVRDRAAWLERLRAVEEPTYYGSPVEWPHSTAWYVKDPTGHEIEVVSWDDDVVAFDPRA